jgi:23S rRNA (adenine2503-C2)-methyltransferase
MGCVFCATAKMGFLRDLTAGQIIEQVLWARRETGRSTEDDGQFLDKRAGMQAPDCEGEGHVHGQQAGPERLVGPGSGVELSNVVFMGMGEAFNNYEAWWESVERLHDPAGFNMGARSFTVSTVGLVPGIERLAREELPINLAISLHAADDELRSEMMPVNRAYPIQALLQAARDYGEMTHRRVSFEYVLLEGKNDTPEQAEELARVFHEGPLGDRLQWTHVNLIPWNPVPGAPLARSSRNRVHAFQQVLQARGIPCTVRIERGVDIDAACGQLAGSHG